MIDIERSRRARIARMAAEAELVVGVLVAFAMLLHYVAAPGFMLPDPSSEVRMAIAIGLATFGFVWMVRIYRDAIRT